MVNYICLSTVLLITTVNLANAALTAITANTIQGTAPYLTFDGGVTKVTNMDALLGITLSNGTTFTKLTNTSTASNPIELPVANETLGDITTSIPAGLTTVNLSTLIVAPYNRWGDDDGDGQGAADVSATGSLYLTLRDVRGKSVSLTQVLSPCGSPYTLTVNSTSGTLNTKYGDPRSTSFTASNVTYYIKPKIIAPYVCYAKPNLLDKWVNYGYGAWNPVEGFMLQNLGTPSKNFPRTGFNGAFFDITVERGTAANIISANGAIVNATSGATNIQLKLSQQSTNVVRVKLSGPSSGKKVGQPGPAAVTMPTQFDIYSDVAKTNKIYSFELKHWFIANTEAYAFDGRILHSGVTAEQYCTNLPGSYQMPAITHYTNAQNYGSTHQPFNHYLRMIGEGVFSEWGNTSQVYYTDSDWQGSKYYWTYYISSAITNYMRVVRSNDGSIGDSNPTQYLGHSVACVTP